jgi:hypothetical protein
MAVVMRMRALLAIRVYLRNDKDNIKIYRINILNNYHYPDRLSQGIPL